jgi:hypothetical protein
MSKAGELAWWKLDDGSGNVATDSSGHGYHGNVEGATWVSGGLSFDGSNDYVEFDTHAQDIGMNKTDDYFVFVQFETTGSGMLYSMSHTNPARAYLDLFIDAQGHVKVEAGDETCLFELTSSGTFNDGDPHTVEMEFYGDAVNPTMEIYVDGNLEASTTEWLCPMLDEDFLTATLGRNSNDASGYYDGEIYDVKIYKNYYPNKAPYAPTITGPGQGSTGQTLTFVFNAIDRDGDNVRFHIEWGDGNSDTTDYVGSGVDKDASHSWSTEKTFTITAKAQDDQGYFGPEITKSVSIPRNLEFNFYQLLLEFLEQYPNLFPILRYVIGL